MRDWRTITEVADMFDVSTTTVHQWISKGLLSAERAKRSIFLVHDSAIEQFRARRHPANTQPAARDGKTSSRPSVRSSIDPNKRYRLKGTDEVVTGAEVLRRRGQA